MNLFHKTVAFATAIPQLQQLQEEFRNFLFHKAFRDSATAIPQSRNSAAILKARLNLKRGSQAGQHDTVILFAWRYSFNFKIRRDYCHDMPSIRYELEKVDKFHIISLIVMLSFYASISTPLYSSLILH